MTRKVISLPAKRINTLADIEGYKLVSNVALPVHVVSEGDILGGPAVAVYVITDSDINSGDFVVASGPSLPVIEAESDIDVVGKIVIPVYIVTSPSEVAYWTVGESEVGSLDKIS